MKRFFAFVLVLCASLVGAQAQGLDDQYVQIFNLIQEADSLSASQPAKALAKYVDAQNALLRIQKGSPDWNPKIISFRLAYIAARIGGISTNAPAPAAATGTDTNKVAVSADTNAPPAPAQVPTVPPELQAQITSLNEQVRQLQADRIVMEAKLKEALAVQPAQADPMELAKAQERIRMLQKENDLLKSAAEAEKSRPTVDTQAIEAAKQSQAEAARRLEEQKQLVARLTLERDALQNKIKSNPDTSALQAENQLLKQKLAATQQPPGQPDDAAKKLSEAQAQVASLQSDKDLLRIQNLALENRLKLLTTNTVASSVLPVGAGDDSVRVKQLERERQDLQKKLDAANKALYGRKGKNAAARVQELEVELSTARARLEVLDARQVPYAAEELALMKAPEPKLAAAPPKSTRKPTSELPPGSTALVTQAQTWFASRQYDKAENAYLQVVKMDPRNVPALANLAVVQIEGGHLDQAEKNVKTALSEDPEDAFSQRTLGILKFRQGKYDESLDALSRAAKLDPENPEIQNYLGLVLSEKGMRGPAETALRKAIQLQPNYGAAHYNLAIVYLAQQPPATELARWHYQKALSAGHPTNPDVEKKLEAR